VERREKREKRRGGRPREGIAYHKHK